MNVQERYWWNVMWNVHDVKDNKNMRQFGVAHEI